ncbi:hypothetical protein CPB84DRAFT_1798603 [Gymnopilus junonius]|uniref:Uncharacterized protein n=1 Tax=Gymnopilus junonius TaxID=109634 RepID=A0A9P5N9M7_GYMJU|nr:hypothetical protein CPB84DRAFT_1798603 [Gymnopilus junonius]
MPIIYSWPNREPIASSKFHSRHDPSRRTWSLSAITEFHSSCEYSVYVTGAKMVEEWYNSFPGMP